MPKKRSTKPPVKPPAKTKTLARVTPQPQPDQVEQVLKWLLLGSRDQDILASIRTNYPDFAADPSPLVMAAIDELRESAEFDADVVIGWCFEATKLCYQKMFEFGDYAGALRAVRQLAEMSSR